MSIHILPPEVAAKIAAGEVVERPASVVKEIVENSIDAGASSVRIEVREGGRRLIRVSDDGCGIPNEEVPLAFTRHATSKLTDIEDLEHITTLGFRGEALASIAAVSRMTLVTRPVAVPPENSSAGTQIRIEGGQQLSLGPSGTPVGTTITVENLFFNVPARLKFLKAPATESGHIHRAVTSYALAYPEISFHLKIDQRVALQTSGSGKRLDVLIDVFGLKAVEQMEALADSQPGEQTRPRNIQVSGYVGMPSLHRAQRDQLIFFVNRRWVQDRSLNTAVTQAYHTFLPIGRYPVAVIDISLDAADVDVNVHPTKSEVKFRDQRAVFAAVQKAVRSTVIGAARPPEFDTGQGISQSSSSWWGEPSGGPRQGEQWHQFGFEAQRTLPGQEDGLSSSNAERLPMLRVVGQVAQSYIITEGPDGLYLLDQHAAHERVLYEQLQAERAQDSVTTQQLLQPCTLELVPAQLAVLEAEIDTLTHIGFEIEPFGGSTYRIRAVPEILVGPDPAVALGDILAELAEGVVPLSRESDERLIITVCKRAAVKAGKTLSGEEMQRLIHDLEQCDSPRTCPHGRPTMLHLSAAQLAREFGRS